MLGADAEGQHGAGRQRLRGGQGDGARDGRRALVGGGGAQGERARAELGEAARTGAEAGGDGDVGAEVQGGAAFADIDGAQDDGIVEPSGEAERAAAEDERSGVAADVVEVGDLQDAFVDHRRESSAAGDVHRRKDERAAAGLGQGGRRAQGRSDGDRQGRGGRGGGRIDDAEDILGGSA